ncbi:MAG: hypothetical protein HRT35_11635, partial [Algicola sp.]|nr:hypothetical protein [Algicola sp.]
MKAALKKTVKQTIKQKMQPLGLWLLLVGFVSGANAATDIRNDVTGVALKTVPAHYFYFIKKRLNKVDIADKSIVVGLQMVSVLKKKTNAKITGGFTFVYHDLHKATGPQIEVEMGLPISRKAKRQKGFKSKKNADFKCSYQSFEGQTEQLKAAWTALYQQTLDAGHQLAGESRTVVLNPST